LEDLKMRRGLATALAQGLASAALGLASACAHAPVPSDQLAAAQANVARAEQMGADSNPDASYHLRLARQQLDEGKKLMDKKDNLEASYVLKRAAADGELAVAVAEYGNASTQAEQSRAQVQALRERTGNTMQNNTQPQSQSPKTKPPQSGDSGDRDQTRDMSNGDNTNE
jgi:hypothetical protein